MVVWVYEAVTWRSLLGVRLVIFGLSKNKWEFSLLLV